MALSTAIENFALTAAATVAVAVPLNDQKSYEIQHTQYNAAGAADLNTVFVGLVDTVAATYAESDGKVALVAGGPSIVLPPGKSTVYLICAAGAPVVSITATASWRGHF